MKTLFVVIGHGASFSHKKRRHDPGATTMNRNMQITERELLVNIGKYMQKNISSRVIFVGLDTELTLNEKINTINMLCREKKLDHNNALLVSLHIDWSGAPSGIAGYYYWGSKESQDFCRNSAMNIAQNLHIPVRFIKDDRKSRFGRLGVVRDTIPLAILLEIGSIGENFELLKNNAKQVGNILAETFSQLLDEEQGAKTCP
jgi:N-acetylmuramoyl-L-alanine amidase